MGRNVESNEYKQFLVLPHAREVYSINQVSGSEVKIKLREGEILLNPGDIDPDGIIGGDECSCGIEYIREITRIKKHVQFDDVEVVEGGKAIFNARLVKNIEFKVTNSPTCPEFSGVIAFKVVEIPFAGYIELKGAECGDKVKLVGVIEGELDRPPIGFPFIAVNEPGGEEELRLLHKLPGAIILTEKTVVKVCGELSNKCEEQC